MTKYFYAYDIFGHGRYGFEDYAVMESDSFDKVFTHANTTACDEWCSYGGLHGIGYGEDEIEEKLEEGLSREEIVEEEWQQAQDEVDVSVLDEDAFRKWLAGDGYTTEEIEKIVLDLSGQT